MLVLEARDVRGRVRQLEVSSLAEVAIDRFLGDQPLDGLVAGECLAVEGVASLLAVALDQLGRSPLVAGVDDATVAGRRTPAQRPGLEKRHGHSPAGEFTGRIDPGVPATDD